MTSRSELLKSAFVDIIELRNAARDGASDQQLADIEQTIREKLNEAVVSDLEASQILLNVSDLLSSLTRILDPDDVKQEETWSIVCSILGEIERIKSPDS